MPKYRIPPTRQPESCTVSCCVPLNPVEGRKRTSKVVQQFFDGKIHCIPLYPANSIFRCATTVQNRDRQAIFAGFRLYPAIVSGLLFFAGFWMFFGSLDAAVILRKPLWLWVECSVIPLSDFRGKTVLSITKPLLYH
jgi:hypothetical protein